MTSAKIVKSYPADVAKDRPVVRRIVYARMIEDYLVRIIEFLVDEIPDHEPVAPSLGVAIR